MYRYFVVDSWLPEYKCTFEYLSENCFLGWGSYDEAYDAFKKMLIWRKEKDVQKYFEKVKEVGFDVHKVPHADVFETYIILILFN